MASRTFVALVACLILAGPILSSISTDVSITKTDGVTTAVPGGSVTYTITVSNTGNDVSGVSVSDTFPGTLTCSWTCSASAGSSCAASGMGNIADTISILDGGTATYTAMCSIDPSATGTLSNTATVSLAADSNAANNTATDSDTVLVPSADLSITKSDSADPVLPGASYSYTLQVSNAGPSVATGVTVSDTLPAGVSLVSTSGCAEDPTGVPTCTLGTIAASASSSYTINVTAPVSGGTVTNTATVSAATADPNGANDSASEMTTVQPSADLSITKTDGVTAAVPGGSLNYTITATNNGPNDVTGATVTDTFPSALTCNWTCSASAGSSCTAAGSGSISESVDLLNGGSATFVAACTIDLSTTGTLSNTASIMSSTFDAVAGNNSATDSDTVVMASADLSITKTDGVTSASPGGSLSYTITASNNGPNDVIGATVTDTFPSALTCNWTCSASAGSSCTAAGSGSISESVDLLNGGSATFVAACTIGPAATGTLSNTAAISSSTADPVPGNNSATDADTVLMPSADLELISSSGPNPVVSGGPVTYVLDVMNNGPSDATGVQIASTLDPALTFVSSTGCAEDPNGSPTCTVGTIAAGGSAMVTLVATAPTVSGALSSSFTVSSPTTNDPVGANDTSVSASTVGLAIPTAGTWGLLLFGTLLAGLGLRFLRL